MTCGTCRKCAWFDMSVNFASVGSGASAINFCGKHHIHMKQDAPRCEEFELHERRKNWSDD